MTSPRPGDPGRPCASPDARAGGGHASEAGAPPVPPAARAAARAVDPAPPPGGPDDEPLADIRRRGDRWMAAFIAAHSVLALVLASVHDTWRIAGAVVALAGGGFAVLATRWPGRFATRTAAGLALQAFCALHIFQMRGLAEMHFFYFTATTAMIIYQDWRALWPGVLAIVAQHLVFSALHNAGVHPGGHPYFDTERVDALKLVFHFGIACAQAAVASYWAELLRRRTIAAAAAHRDLRGHAQALAESERRFRTVVESVDHGLLITDREHRILYANARAVDITGYPADELVGRVGVEVLVPEDQRAAFRARMANRLRGETERYELPLVRRDGTQVWTETSGVPFRDGSGDIVGTIGVVTDITVRRALEAELTRQAFEDPLTGLANRSRLRARIDRALARAEPGQPPAVLLVDLDDFKHINDSLGHAAGDHLLSLVAGRLLDATRGSDTVARLGGDEFAVLLGGVRGDAEATLVAERVVHALRTPFPLEGRDIRVGASVGVAVAAAGDASDDLLRNADLALYRAKALGKDGHAVFAPEMHAAAVERLELATELRRAVDGHEFVLHYQPVVDLATRGTVGVEALVRWRHPERGLVSPAAFIPLAEATGLIVPLGRWVLAEACRAVAAWNARRAPGAAPLNVAVNVSSRQLQDPGLLEDVASALRASALPAGRLVLEVTESVLLDNLEAALGRLEALRALGVRVSLDDFGTGYSSLAYLQRLPVDVLKIDRAFTSQVAAGGRSAAFARAVLTFAGALGMRTVAEGVETEAQHGELRTLGCDLGQGFLYARPLEPEALAAFLRTHPPPPVAVAAAPPPDAAGAPASRASTVLVVDDDAAVRRTVRRMLEPRGFAVLEAHDGADALRRLAAHHDGVDLVLTDVAMPELSGGALAEALRSARSAERHTPPVLFMSGQPLDGLPPLDLAGAGASLLPKPFSSAQLLAHVGLALETYPAA